MTARATVVYGASDDLIEFEGAIDDEIGASYGKEDRLTFSTGVVLTVRYEKDGFWRIRQVEGPEVSIVRCEQDDPDNDDRDYSDRATVPDAEWVEYVSGGETHRIEADR